MIHTNRAQSTSAAWANLSSGGPSETAKKYQENLWDNSNKCATTIARCENVGMILHLQSRSHLHHQKMDDFHKYKGVGSISARISSYSISKALQ